MGDLQKQYKDNLEKTKNILDDLIELRKKGIHRYDDSITNKLEQLTWLRQLMSVEKEHWIEQFDDESLDDMIRKWSSELQCLSRLVESTPTNSAAEILERASGGLALRGIPVGQSFRDDCVKRIVLSTPTDVKLLDSVMMQVENEEHFISKSQYDHFHRCLDRMGYTAALTVKGDCLEFNTKNDLSKNYEEGDEKESKRHRQFHFESRVKYLVVPTAACELNKHSLKLSKEALDELKEIDRLLAGSKNLELVDKKCEDFLTAYGSYINVGILHFGGVYKFVATYTSETESKSDRSKCMVREALRAYASASYSGFGCSVGGSLSADKIHKNGTFKNKYEKSEQAKTILHNIRNGGPKGVSDLQLWKNGLVNCNNTWALIDRGRPLSQDIVGIWELITNHEGEFEEPCKVENSLMKAWEKMRTNLACRDQERNILKGLDPMDQLINRIAEWNSYPILPVKCIEYLQEIVKTVEEVEALTNTNKYWVKNLCTDEHISSFLVKIVELGDKLEPNQVSMIRYLLRKLVDSARSSEFPGKQMIIKWAVITKTEDIPSVLADVKNIPDLIWNLKEKFITSLEIEHAKNEEENAQVIDGINARATVNMALCVGRLLKDLQSSGEEHEMFFLKVALLSIHYHWPAMTFEKHLTLETLQNFVQSIDVSWKEFQVYKEKGIIQFEAFLIHMTLSSGHFDEERESSESEFSEIIKELRQVLSPLLNEVLNKYATSSPFNWVSMINVTSELASGNISACQEKEVKIVDLENIASPGGNTHRDGPIITTNSVKTAQGTFSEILNTLGLEKYYPSKISILNAIAIKNTPEQLRLHDIPWMIIHKLLMTDFRARDELLSLIKKSREERCVNRGGFDLEAHLEMQQARCDEDKQTQLSTLDALVVMFTCCDNFLKQTLAEKLFVCKLAIPFLYPIGTEDKIGMSLWTLRTITVQWHDKRKEVSETTVTEKPFPVVSFLRLGRPPLSKSKLVNDILSDSSHDTFFHYDCNNGSTARRVTKGLVECSWFISTGKEIEHLPGTTMLLNLRGDASSIKKEMHILKKMSSVLFVVVTAQDLARTPNSETCREILQTNAKVIIFLISRDIEQSTHQLQACYKAVGKDFLKGVPVMLSYNPQGIQKNASELKTEARQFLSEALASCSSIDLPECAEFARKMGVIIDEYDDEACCKGKVFAEKVVSHMEGNDMEDCKGVLLPLQGTEWIEYCKLLKRQHRADGKGSQSSTYEANQVKQKMDRLREKQVEICNRLTPFIKDFMLTLWNNQNVVMYFLKWMKIFLDDKSRAKLPGLRRQYHAVWTQLQEAKKVQHREDVENMKSQVHNVENQLSSASLGLENLFRELGQLYEAMQEITNVGEGTRAGVEYLPEKAAELLLNGVPLELVDGDASSVPIAWVCAVLSKVGSIIGEKKLFVLSVLGIQSSGKSTLLNTMFGLQFTVGAGRCTRGAYMQLIPVDEYADLPFDYVVVVDTEGLRAPELGQYEHDNELATLVIGLGDVTLINIKGENMAEMKDILQIAVQAFLRMNLVTRHIQDHRTCLFIHQNVPAAKADELAMPGCHKLQEGLDDMTKEAAHSENIADIQSFSQIIDFDVVKHVWYFSDLWHGNPPMAPSNPGYSEKVGQVKLSLLGEIAKRRTFLKPSELSIRLTDLWNGILADDFVFSFRNSLAVKAYNTLQSIYYTLEWELEDGMKSWSNSAEIKLKRCETIDDLDTFHQLLNNELADVLNTKTEKIKKSLMDYFDNCSLREITNQWKQPKLIQLAFAVEQQKNDSKADLLSVKEACRVEILQAQKWSDQKEHIMARAVEWADKLKGKEATDAELTKKFDEMWISMANDIATKTANKEVKIDLVLEEILQQVLHAHKDILKKELNRHPLKTPLDQSSLESSVTAYFVKNEHISLKIDTFRKSGYKFLASTANVQLEARNETFVLTSSILKEIATDLKGFCQRDVKFPKPYFTSVMQKLVEKIDTHNQNARVSDECGFTILPKYVVKLAVHVSRHCAKVFTLMQSSYNKEHDVKAKLQDFKKSTWTLFKNMVKRSTEEVMAGDLLCTELKIIVYEAVKTEIPRICTREVLTDLQMTKYVLIVKIMEDLAKKGNFEYYKSYIRNAKEFALKWITQYTDEKMFSIKESGGMSRYAEISRSHIARIMRCIATSVCQATNEVDGQRGMRMTQWIKQFCERVSEEIAVPVRTLTLVKDRSVIDFNNLQRIILEQLGEVQKNLEESFALTTAHSVDWKGTSPPQQILDKVWGCPDQCPFCREPCADTTPDHYELSGICHMCVQHRPEGIGGVLLHYSKNLGHTTCNFNVSLSSGEFRCSACGYKCRDSGKCSTTGENSILHRSRKYKTYLPTWDIAPNPTDKVSKYWKWFMVTYKHQLKDMYKDKKAKMPHIPHSWMKVTKEDALTDLRKIHHQETS